MSQRTCHFWKKGACKFGDKCKFAHPAFNSPKLIPISPASAGKSRQNKRICHNWKRDGQCRFGSSCRYVHDGASQGTSIDKNQSGFVQNSNKLTVQEEVKVHRQQSPSYDDKCRYANSLMNIYQRVDPTQSDQQKAYIERLIMEFGANFDSLHGVYCQECNKYNVPMTERLRSTSADNNVNDLDSLI